MRKIEVADEILTFLQDELVECVVSHTLDNVHEEYNDEDTCLSESDSETGVQLYSSSFMLKRES